MDGSSWNLRFLKKNSKAKPHNNSVEPNPPAAAEAHPLVGSAKPSYVGSNPTVASKQQQATLGNASPFVTHIMPGCLKVRRGWCHGYDSWGFISLSYAG